MPFTVRNCAVAVLCCGILAACAGPEKESGPAPGGYFVPPEIPRSRYDIEARIEPRAGLVDGRETIVLVNPSGRSLNTIALDWGLDAGRSMEVTAGGEILAPRREGTGPDIASPVFFELPSEVQAGGRLELRVVFREKTDPSAEDVGFMRTDWYPRLWWDGLRSHDDYSVALTVPDGCALAASGRRDETSGRFEASGARTFGVYLGPGEKTETREVEGVRITAVFTEKGRKAAALCLETAADAVKYYRDWVGFYPYPFLTIVPGGSGRWGGYPFATGIVAIHGLETYRDGESPRHWRHITSHEIGHEYWGEWVIDGDRPGWLWICLGIHMDTEYMIARAYEPDRRGSWMGNYRRAVGMYYDTTLDVTPDQDDRFLYDRNNLVVHSKGPAFINALTVALGPAGFDRLFRKALRDYGGRRLGWREFQRFCEAETGQDLAWFFDAWVRGNGYLCYGIESRECVPSKDGFRTEVRVRRLGTMAMPVAVKAAFEDGSEQTGLTDRTRTLDVLVFESRSRLKEAILDPEGRLAMIPKPRPDIPDEAAAALAWGLDSGKSLEVYGLLRETAVETADLWEGLGRNLFELDRYAEAGDCFARMSADPDFAFSAAAWLGIVADLAGRRESALKHYREALALDQGETLDYGNLNLKIDRAWLEARLRNPYARESELALPGKPSAGDLETLVSNLGWTHEGRNPRRIFEKAAGLEIPRFPFWFKLGMLLFDSADYAPSLTAFVKAASSPDASGLQKFSALTWQGHINDLLGRREAALEAYRRALEADTGQAMTHSQYRMKLDRAWVELRLKTPFAGKKRS